jgi:hypothetical protein
MGKMGQQWGQMAALAVSVALSACGGGTDNGADTTGNATPSNLTPADPSASTPTSSEAELLNWLNSLPATQSQAGTPILETAPTSGAFTVLGPTWLAGASHELNIGVRGQLSSDTTSAVALMPSTPTHDLSGGADLVIGRVDGNVKVGEAAVSARQFSYVLAKPSSSLPAESKVIYTLGQATLADVRVTGNALPAAARVTITGATLTANFTPNVTLPLTLTLTGNLGNRSYTYTLTDNKTTPTARIDRAAASFAANNGSARFEAVFTGSNADQVGVHYTITIDGGSLDGSLILKRL